MLKQILISKVRIRVLEQFFFNPLTPYHVRGLVRILDEEINAIRRELLNLEAAGLLKSEKDTNKIVFRIVPTNPIIEDLRNLILKSSSLGKKLLKLSSDSGKVECVILTEAFLNNSYNDPNDVDLLFIGDLDVKKLASGMKEIETDLNRELRFTIMSAQDFDFGRKKRTPVILNTLNGDFVQIVGTIKRLII